MGTRGLSIMRADEVVDRAGREQRLVALHVDVELGGDLVGDLGHAVGAGAVRLLRHHHIRAELGRDIGDAVVVGGDDDLLGQAAAAGGFPDPLDHGPALDAGEALAGKAGRAVARGNDDDGFHLRKQIR